MSAFMCTDKHLTVLAMYAVQYGLDLHGDSRMTLLERERAAYRLLFRANVASLDARYPGDTGRDIPGDLDETTRPFQRALSGLAIVKQCHCYAYQACETTGWEGCRAQLLIEAIEAHAIRSLDGYAGIPWGL